MNAKIPSSVDMTGDLSRNTRLNDRIRAPASVGAPLDSRPYDPNRKDQHIAEGVSVKLVDCVLVLRTFDLDDNEEYRIGKFMNEDQILKEGLRRKDNPSLLNPPVALSCFGKSKVLPDRLAAIEHAEKTYPKNSGIKVLRMHCTFP